MKRFWMLFAVLPMFVFAQEAKRGGFSYPPKLDGAKVETYRKAGDTELKVWIFEPKEAAKDRPAIVFFFGGGWKSGSPAQFERQCRHLASRGMVAMTADYRVASRNQVKPTECVADAKACVRWVRANAERLGIDPKRIAAAGGSAGGHLAAAVATVPGLDDEKDAKVSCVPDALVLFNPALMLAPFEGVDAKGFGTNLSKEMMGCAPEEISPIHHVKKGTPPAIIFHGKADTTVPYSTAEGFAAQMKKLGNRCELVGYEGQPHGFFNGAKFEETLAEADKFLVSLGWIPPAK
jgi:acetyl esterase